MSKNNLVQQLVTAIMHAIGDTVLIISSDNHVPKSVGWAEKWVSNNVSWWMREGCLFTIYAKRDTR